MTVSNAVPLSAVEISAALSGSAWKYVCVCNSPFSNPKNLVVRLTSPPRELIVPARASIVPESSSIERVDPAKSYRRSRTATT